MGLKSAAALQKVFGKFDGGQALKGISNVFSVPPVGGSPQLNFSVIGNSQYLSMLSEDWIM